MSKILRCSELIPGCNFIARGESDEEVIEEASRHVRARHNLQKMSAGVVAIIRGAIYDEEEDAPLKKRAKSASHVGHDGATDGHAGRVWWPQGTGRGPD
ncbi:MAG TPA: DUF1059 domain-containing protein [Candidatus Acidoferrales bacterium]|nr:DUF1059 domain-containing protein [Candidatus Acidoferrales bacterium]